MIKKDTRLFLSVPSLRAQRVLHRCRIASAGDSTYTLQLDAPIARLEPDLDARLYFRHANRFMSQRARIVAVVSTEPTQILEVELRGPPASADEREDARFPAEHLGLQASLGSEEPSPIFDISAMGFSVDASVDLCIGTTVDATLFHDGRAYAGKVRVANARPAFQAQIRYGLCCVDNSELKLALANLTTNVQLERARRGPRPGSRG